MKTDFHNTTDSDIDTPENSNNSWPAQLDSKVRNYAKLIIARGCDLREGQELFLSVDTECADFARVLVEEAYAAGCKRVYTNWSDRSISRLDYLNVSLEEFKTYPEWSALEHNTLAQRGAAILRIETADPDFMAGVDPVKISSSMLSAHSACKEFYDSMDYAKNIWCIAAAPCKAWAKYVFPDLDSKNAISRLWEEILVASRAMSDDPIANWTEHDKSFEQRKSWLDSLDLYELRYKTDHGTNICIGLPKGVLWHGGAGETVDGRRFFPNIPTEEIYTSPDRMRVDGLVRSALPLSYQGNLIEDFEIYFENGKATKCSAKSGQEILESIISVDEGSCYLGEVALVPFSSPIRQSGLLFYNTLFDENASCHLALGKSFPECIEGGLDLGKSELLECGLNDSAIHVDFMVGTQDLQITGICSNGQEVPIFEDGEWAEM